MPRFEAQCCQHVVCWVLGEWARPEKEFVYYAQINRATIRKKSRDWFSPRSGDRSAVLAVLRLDFECPAQGGGLVWTAPSRPLSAVPRDRGPQHRSSPPTSLGAVSASLSTVSHMPPDWPPALGHPSVSPFATLLPKLPLWSLGFLAQNPSVTPFSRCKILLQLPVFLSPSVRDGNEAARTA